MKIIITGAGISGLSIGQMLTGNHEVEIIEQQDRPGGLIKCDHIEGNLFHKVGGHVFNSKNPIVLDWFWKHFSKDNEFLLARRNAKILINNGLIGYPIENNLFQIPASFTSKIVKELIELTKKSSKTPIQFNNFKDFLVGNFGKTLFELYFEPYNSKIWNSKLEQIPLNWLDGKLPMPNIQDIILSNILRLEESNMVHNTFFYPKKNGSQFLVDRFSKNLAIQCNFKLTSIKYFKNLLLINNKKQTELLIYCGDIRNLHEIIQINDNELKKALFNVKNLKSNGTSNVLCETDSTDISWLYIPERQYQSHRIIYTGNFSEFNNSPQINRKTCVVEFSGKHDFKTVKNEIQKLPGNLKALAFNYEPNSYIIHEHNTRKLVTELKNQLKKYNIYLLGRFAEWQYYNMDKCMEAALELKESIK
jgi:protoporphyrinogen oxidase